MTTMDVTTPLPAPGAPRLLLRGSALVLSVGLLASCGGTDDDPAAAPTTETIAPQTSDAATSDAATSDASADATTSDDDQTSDDDEVEAEDVTIVIADFEYEVPDSVAPGAEITIRNEDNVGHTVTSDDETTFDVQVGPGEEVTMTAPDEAGEFPFFCRPHPNMKATLVVEEG